MEWPESVDCRVSFLTEQNYISLLGLLSLILISLQGICSWVLFIVWELWKFSSSRNYSVRALLQDKIILQIM